MADPISLTAMAASAGSFFSSGGATAALGAVSLGSSLWGAVTGQQGAALQAQAAQVQQRGAAIQAQGAALEAQAQANMYTYQSGVALLNKKIADQNASYALAVGDVKAQMAGMATRAQLAQTRAAQGASGLEGVSQQRVRESEIELGYFDQATIRSDAARQAYGYTVQGLNYQAESDLEKVSAQNALTAGAYRVAAYQTEEAGYKVAEESAGISGMSTLLGSAGSISKTALGFMQSGVFSGGSSKPSTPTVIG